ncbi:MAG: type I glyceraldehyde-3-phosphate dehydrogenase, partial [Candidatus Hodarchaeales archaeon]
MSENIPKIGINGFGRIGRLVTRAFLSIAYHAIDLGLNKKVDIVAINDLSSPDMLANLFEFDSIHGRFPGKVEVDNSTNELIFDKDRFKVLSTRYPDQLPWKELECDYVIESTGAFRDRAGLSKHLDAGARKVILTAPSKTPQDVDFTVVRGVNHKQLKSDHKIISNGSSTANCIAPVLKVLDDLFGVEHGTMTTIHSYTNDQRTLDSQHDDFRRARSA